MSRHKPRAVAIRKRNTEFRSVTELVRSWPADELDVNRSPSAGRRLSVRVAGRVSRTASGRSPTRVHDPPPPQLAMAASTPSSSMTTSSSTTRARTTSIAVSDAMSRPEARRSRQAILEPYAYATPNESRKRRLATRWSLATPACRATSQALVRDSIRSARQTSPADRSGRPHARRRSKGGPGVDERGLVLDRQDRGDRSRQGDRVA